MGKRVSNNLGDWFQKEFWKLLLEIRDEMYPAFVHEFVDSKQARAMVRPQPSDFMAKLPAWSNHYLEVKASEKHDSLRSCFAMVRDTQLSMARDLTKCNCVYTVWFYSEPMNEIEIWDGAELAKNRADGKPLGEPLKIFTWPDLKEEIINALQTNTTIEIR